MKLQRLFPWIVVFGILLVSPLFAGASTTGISLLSESHYAYGDSWGAYASSAPWDESITQTHATGVDSSQLEVHGSGWADFHLYDNPSSPDRQVTGTERVSSASSAGHFRVGIQVNGQVFRLCLKTCDLLALSFRRNRNESHQKREEYEQTI